MTISSETNLNTYSGNGSTTVFAYGFKIFADADLRVILKNNTTGVETVQTLTTDYTVSNAGTDSGGNVTFGTAPASGNTVIIRRNLAHTQTTDYVENDAFPANAHEDALDRLTMLSQQNESTLDVSIQFPEGDRGSGLENKTPSAVDRANKLLGFDSTGAVTTTVVAADAQTIADIATDITTLAHIEDGTDATDAITNVNTIRTDVSTVSSISSDVSTVANNTSNIDTVATDLDGDDDIGTVAGSIANVNATGSNISNVNSVAGNATNINTVATDLTGDNDIGTVADSNTYIKTTALTINDVTTVAGIASDVTAVAGNNANITSVANNEANINAASGHATTASTKASEASTSATEAATSATNAATSATNAATSETNAATSATNAAASATAAAASAASIDPDDIDINGGTIDGVTLGSSNTYNAISHTGTATFSTTGNLPNLILKSTDGDPSVGPVFRLYRDSASPASNDTLGRIEFRGEDSAGDDTMYSYMQARITDPTDGAVTAQFQHYALINGTSREIWSIEEVVADSGNIEFVVNPSNVGDVDFRVKADSGVALKVDSTSSGKVGVLTSEPETALDVRGDLQIKTGQPQLDFIDTTNDGNLSRFVGNNTGLLLNLKGSDSVNGGSFNVRQYDGSNYQTRFQIQTDGDIEMRDDAGLVKFNFDASNGNLNIGASTADASAQLRVEGDVRVVDANIRLDDRLQIGSQNSTQAIDAALHIRGSITDGEANFTAYVDAGSNVLNVTAVSSGTLDIGKTVYNHARLPARTKILEQLSGTTGGVGTYELSQAAIEAIGSSTSPQTGLRCSNTANTTMLIENLDGGVLTGQPIGTIDFYDSDSTTDGVKGFIHVAAQDSSPDTYLAFGTNSQTGGTRETAREVGRFDHNGNFLVGKVRDNFNLAGIQLQRNGQGAFTSDGETPLHARRLTDDGDLITGRRDDRNTARIMSVASTAEAPVYANGDGHGVKVMNSYLLPWDGVTDEARDNTVDLGTTTARYKRLYLSNNAEIDGTTNTENLRVGSGVTVDTILDQDGLTSNSATALATQQSIKAYVDANSGFVSGSVGTLEQVTQNGATAAATVTLGGLGVTGSTALDSAGASTLTLKRNGGTDSNTVIVFDQATADSYIGADSSNSFVIGNALNLGVNRRAKFDQNGDVSLYEDTGTTPKFFWDASTERLGLGTSSPSTALDVRNGIIKVEEGSNLTFYEEDKIHSYATNGFAIDGREGLTLETSSANTNIVLNPTGNVGIGTVSPATKLEVANTSGGVDLALRSSTTGAASLYFGDSNSIIQGRVAYDNSNNSLAFTTAASERMRLDASGNALFGTTLTPTSIATATLNANQGVGISDSGFIAAANEAGVVQTLNRLGTDGAILQFRKQGVEVGSIGTASSGNFYIEGSGNHSGLEFGTNVVVPFKQGAATDGVCNLGGPLNRFKDFYLSEDIFLSNGSLLKFKDSGGADRTILTFDSNNDVVYAPAGAGVNNHIWKRNGSEKMRLDTGGNLLVGKTSAAGASTVGIEVRPNGDLISTRSGDQPLTLNRTTSDGTIAQFRKDNVAVGSIGTGGGSLDVYSSGSGKVGLRLSQSVIPMLNGATSPDTVDLGTTTRAFRHLYISGDANIGDLKGTNDGDTRVRFLGSDRLAFNTGGLEAARFDASQNFIVGSTVTGTSSDGARLMSDGHARFTTDGGTALYLNRRTSGGSIIEFRKDNTGVGSVSVSNTATTYNTSSDQRLKDNIVDAPSASDDIDAIQVRSFDWKADGSHQKYGMVAQELQSVAPEAVTGDADSDDMMGVDYSKLVPMLVKEIQSLRARVAQLEGEN